MSKAANPGEGQFMLEGGEYHEPPRVDMARPRNSMSRALTTEYLDLNPNDFMDVTVEMVKYVQPDQLRPHLVDVPLNLQESPCAVSYTDARSRAERNIALTPQEAKLLPRFMGAFQRNAAIGSGAKVMTPQPTDSDIARSERAKLHAQESKLEPMQQYKRTLDTNLELLHKFEVASRGRNVGLSLFGSEGNMRNRLSYLQTFILDPMLQAYGEQRQLNAEQRKQVAKAVRYSLFVHPDKISHFHSMMNFLIEYNGHKMELVTQRIRSVEHNLGKVAVPRSE